MLTVLPSHAVCPRRSYCSPLFRALQAHSSAVGASWGPSPMDVDEQVPTAREQAMAQAMEEVRRAMTAFVNCSRRSRTAAPVNFTSTLFCRRFKSTAGWRRSLRVLLQGHKFKGKAGCFQKFTVKTSEKYRLIVAPSRMRHNFHTQGGRYPNPVPGSGPVQPMPLELYRAYVIGCV